jgi:hypothetical protein
MSHDSQSRADALNDTEKTLFATAVGRGVEARTDRDRERGRDRYGERERA